MGNDLGWIKINRKILQWEWYTDANTTRLFLHLILMANCKDGRCRGVEVKRGQLVTSYASLSKELKLSVMSIRTALKHLKLTGEITSQSYRYFTLITVVNYDKYQDTLTNQSTGKQQGNNREITGKQQRSKNIRNKEIKKENNKKKESDTEEPKQIAKWWETNNIPRQFWGKFEDEDSFWAWRAQHPDD